MRVCVCECGTIRLFWRTFVPCPAVEFQVARPATLTEGSDKSLSASGQRSQSSNSVGEQRNERIKRRINRNNETKQQQQNEHLPEIHPCRTCSVPAVRACRVPAADEQQLRNRCRLEW